MKKRQIIEAWRNEDYYLSLSDEERAALPENPAGITGTSDEALRSVIGGGCTTNTGLSAACTPCGTKMCSA